MCEDGSFLENAYHLALYQFCSTLVPHPSGQGLNL